MSLFLWFYPNTRVRAFYRVRHVSFFFFLFFFKKTNGPQLSGGRGQRFNPGSTRLPPAHAPHQHQKTLPLLRLLGISQFNVNLSKMKCGAEVLVLTVRQNLKKINKTDLKFSPEVWSQGFQMFEVNWSWNMLFTQIYDLSKNT